MVIKLIQIGNSKGIRIPKAIIEQIGLGDNVDLQIEGGKIVIKPLNLPRKDWEAAFKQMAEAGDDQLLDSENLSHLSKWDGSEWEW